MLVEASARPSCTGAEMSLAPDTLPEGAILRVSMHGNVLSTKSVRVVR